MGDAELLKCPCCGGKANVMHGDISLVVYCTKCGLSTEDAYFITGNRHIELWDKRNPAQENKEG